MSPRSEKEVSFFFVHSTPLMLALMCTLKALLTVPHLPEAYSLLQQKETRLLSASPRTYGICLSAGTADGVKVDQVFKFVPDTTSQATTVTADALSTVRLSSLPLLSLPSFAAKGSCYMHLMLCSIKTAQEQLRKTLDAMRVEGLRS